MNPLDNLAPPTDDVMWSRCRVGHKSHRTKTVRPSHRYFNGKTPRFKVYDWQRYGGDLLDKWDDYCPAQDIISQMIDRQGAWERNESKLFVDILTPPPEGKVVLDFGCQIGWYSTIAAAYGYEVAAIDVSRENLQLAAVNIAALATEPYQTYLGTVGEHASTFAAELPVRIAKIDIEGAERYAIDMLTPTLEAGNVDYLLMEVSPVFNDTYPALMKRLFGLGYVAFDLAATAWQPIRDVDAWFVGLHQTDVLFTRKDLT